MYFPSEEIKNRLNIVDVIGGYLRLQKAGTSYKALCPFHKEKTPSFFVNPARQIWHCFGGCSEGGDVFKFVMKIEGLEFGDALKILAEKAGVRLQKQDPKLISLRSKLYDICEEAAQFFQDQLKTNIGKEVVNYLKGRGINDQSIKEFRLGYAPDSWRSLLKHLTELGYDLSGIEKTGLIIKKQTTNSRQLTPNHGAGPGTVQYPAGRAADNYYDRFRARIMFPIADINNRVVGFTGRVTEGPEEGIAKYINSPQTLIYDKGRILYGLDKAKVEIRKRDECIIVEGNTDLIMSYQAGVKNVVASSGTALGEFQLRIIKRFTPNILISFDMDLAGDSATKKGIDLAQKQGFNIKILTLPQRKDPADYIKGNPQGWPDLISKGKNIYEFYIESAFSKFDKHTAEGKKNISTLLFPVLKNILNKIEQSHWAGKLAQKFNTREEYIMEELAKFKVPSQYQADFEQEETPQKIQKSRRDLLEERLLVTLLQDSKKITILEEDHSFLSTKTQTILKVIQSNGPMRKQLNQEVLDFLDYLELYLEYQKEEYEKLDLEKEISFCFRELKNLDLKDKLENLNSQIQDAEQRGDEKALEELMERFHVLSQQMYFPI